MAIKEIRRFDYDQDKGGNIPNDVKGPERRQDPPAGT